eukprot:scaffold11603_cov107-Isochrysis_galbana.AAC.2
MRNTSEPGYYQFERSTTEWDFTLEEVERLVTKYAPTRARHRRGRRHAQERGVPRRGSRRCRHRLGRRGVARRGVA